MTKSEKLEFIVPFSHDHHHEEIEVALILFGATVTVHQFFFILHFCHTCSLCRVELVVQFPARDSTQVLLCPFPGVLWLWHFLYNVDPHPVSSLHIYTFVVSRAFMASAASQVGDADSSRAPSLTSGLQGSVNVHLGALLLSPQWQCISSFVFYLVIICVEVMSFSILWQEYISISNATSCFWIPTVDQPSSLGRLHIYCTCTYFSATKF